jgi:hypothetical protein
MTNSNWLWLLGLIAALGFALGGCPADTDDDDSADDDDDDAADDDAADDDAGDDDSQAEDCWTQVLSPAGEGCTYTYSSTLDDHLKHNFTMPDDIVHVIATLTWQNARADWQFAVDVGEGTCPDSGTTWLGNYGHEGEVIVDLRPSDLPGAPEVFPAGANTFTHIGLINEVDHVDGDECGYDVTVEVCALQ